MLIEFTVGNYRSFKDLQTLSMIAAPLKSKDKDLDANTIFQVEGQPGLLTCAAIYGANASGKSNLLGALGFVRSFVLNSSKGTRPTGDIDVEPFRLNASTRDAPSSFEIVFIQADVRYRYGFEANQERVISEWLYYTPSSREARLFERRGDEIIVGNKFPEGRKLRSQTRPNALFLSVVAQFNGPTAQSILDWFHNINYGSGMVDFPVRIYTNERFLDIEKADPIRRLVCQLDLGIADLKAERLPFRELDVPDEIPEELAGALKIIFSPNKNAEQIVIRTVHTIYDEDGHPVGQEEFDLDEHESEGTQKLFALAGLILDVLEAGSLLVVDELDARLHPLMTREIVQLFNNHGSNPHGAQLVFNTQDTNLLDNALFRRDQIWFVEKDRRGESHLYSLAEFKDVRNDLSFERHYIQGRFGAVPYLNFNKLLALVTEDDGERA